MDPCPPVVEAQGFNHWTAREVIKKIDSTYKWSHVLLVFVWLTSLRMIISRSIHVAAGGIISYFFVAEWYSILCMYDIFSHPCVDGHLGCFRVLATVNSVSMNTGVRVLF